MSPALILTTSLLSFGPTVPADPPAVPDLPEEIATKPTEWTLEHRGKKYTFKVGMSEDDLVRLLGGKPDEDDKLSDTGRMLVYRPEKKVQAQPGKPPVPAGIAFLMIDGKLERAMALHCVASSPPGRPPGSVPLNEADIGYVYPFRSTNRNWQDAPPSNARELSDRIFREPAEPLMAP